MNDQKPKKDIVKLPAKFCGFSNTTFNRMFIEHGGNDRFGNNNKWVPAEIEVNTKRLQNFLKKISRGSQLSVTVLRKTGPYGLTAELVRAKRVKP